MEETLDQFVNSRMEKLETFNSSRPEKKRVKKQKDRTRVRKGLKRGYELRDQKKNVSTIRSEIKKEMFGSIWITLFSFIISNWGDDIIAWIIAELFPSEDQVELMLGVTP